MSWTSRKHARWWVAFLLPGFLLRAFIPVGFMPMVGPDHSIQLAVCEGFAPLPWATTPMEMSPDMSMDMPMDGDANTTVHRHAHDASHPGGHPPLHQDHTACLYGTSPALGALPTLAVLPEVVQGPVQAALAVSQVSFFKVLPRAQSPRGPPV